MIRCHQEIVITFLLEKFFDSNLDNETLFCKKKQVYLHHESSEIFLYITIRNAHRSLRCIICHLIRLDFNTKFFASKNY